MVQVGHAVDQQKPAWFESVFCVLSFMHYYSIDNRHWSLLSTKSNCELCENSHPYCHNMEVVDQTDLAHPIWDWLCVSVHQTHCLVSWVSHWPSTDIELLFLWSKLIFLEWLIAEASGVLPYYVSQGVSFQSLHILICFRLWCFTKNQNNMCKKNCFKNCCHATELIW